MKHQTLVTAALGITLAAALTTPVHGQETNAASPVIAPGATLQTLATEFQFTEGPTCDKEGNVFFTDQPNNRILKWSVDGKLSTFLQPSGRANGMFFDAQGNLIACADEKNELWSITPDGKHTVLVGEFDGKPLNGPNDVWVHPDGSMYMSDPYYQRSWWTHRQPPQPSQQVYRLAPDRKTMARLTEDLTQPNGIIGTPDGKRLYVADMGARKTYVYDIAGDGTLTGKKLVCNSGSDGMTMDTEGNIYLTGRGVLVFDKDGKQIERIAVPEAPANVCFGGKDRHTLFITARRGLYSIQMKYAGANKAK